MSWPRPENTCSAASSIPAAAPINANSATSRVCMAANQRLKSPQQIVAELDKLRECGMTDTVYFVDDNSSAPQGGRSTCCRISSNGRSGPATSRGSPARRRSTSPSGRRSSKKCARLLVTVFCGIENPRSEALKAMHKDHNMMVPILEGIRTINSYGMEVVSGSSWGSIPTSPRPPTRCSPL